MNKKENGPEACASGPYFQRAAVQVLLDLKDDHQKGEQNECFDESKTKQHRRKDILGGAWVAGDAFQGCCTDLALREATAKCCNPHAKCSRNPQCGVPPTSGPGAFLRKRRRCKRHGGNHYN